jgi:hypothetical protein
MNAPKEAYPLTWPERWPKPKYRERARFSGYSTVESKTDGKPSSYKRTREHTIEEARVYLFAELGRLGASNTILSSNLRLRADGNPVSGQRMPDDPSIAVYFQLRGKPFVLACGKWDRAQDNIWAIAKHVDALRGQERWGVGSIEQAFRGYTALPETSSGSSWWTVLGVTINATPEQVKDAWRAKVKLHHPDNGSEPNHEKMVEVNRAYEQATAQKP